MLLEIILLEFVVYLVEIFYVVCCFEIILSYVRRRGKDDEPPRYPSLTIYIHGSHENVSKVHLLELIYLSNFQTKGPKRLFRVFFGDEISYPVLWGLFHQPLK